MLDHISDSTILFLDIETVPQFPTYEHLPNPFKKLWDKKAAYFKNVEESPADLYAKAGIYAEFGKIVCISVGYISNNPSRQLRIKSYFGDDEKILLEQFSLLLNNHYNKPQHLLCAHNGKEFDFPFLARRMLINGIKLPNILQIAGKKPWEIAHLDTLDLWKFGDYKNYTSLELMATIFGIPTPKDDIDGSQVYSVYWKEQNLNRIVEYCQKDVLTLARLLLKLKGEPMIEDHETIVAPLQVLNPV